MPEHHRYELPVAPEDADRQAAWLWAAGALGVWQQPGQLTAWFAAPSDGVPTGGSWAVEPERDWQEEWKTTIAPVRAGRIVVVPSWLVDDHLPGPDELTLVLDPGRAFGSGHHATTTLCLELLDELDLDGRRVLDVGCGTGVLAIAAAARGAEVLAVDVDPEAVEVSRENAARNGVAVTTRTGSVEVADGPVDVVVANLVTDVVADLAERLVALARPTLVASGITERRQERALAPLRAAGMVVEELRTRDGWVAVRGRTAPSEGAGSPLADRAPDPRG